MSDIEQRFNLLLVDEYHRVSGRLKDLHQVYRNLQDLAGAQRTGQRSPGHAAVREQPGTVKAPGLPRAFDDVEWQDVWFLCASPLPQTGPVGWPAPHHKTICARRLVEQPDGDLVICDLARKSQIRVCDRLEVTAWIMGGEQVLLGPDGINDQQAAPRHVAGALARIFEALWEDAVPVSGGDQPEGLTKAQWRILRLLALGLDDLAMARVTGTTIRTVRSHADAVLAALDAPTRLAAGVEATARGWLG